MQGQALCAVRVARAVAVLAVFRASRRLRARMGAQTNSSADEEREPPNLAFPRLKLAGCGTLNFLRHAGAACNARTVGRKCPMRNVFARNAGRRSLLLVRVAGVSTRRAQGSAAIAVRQLNAVAVPRPDPAPQSSASAERRQLTVMFAIWSARRRSPHASILRTCAT